MLRLGSETVSLALTLLALASGCGGDEKKPATASGGSSGASAGGGQAGLAAGGSAGAGMSGGGGGSTSLGGSAQAGTGGAGGAGGAGCKILKTGETGPHGLTWVHEENIGSALSAASIEDGQLYFAADSKVWALPVAGGTAKSLGEFYGTRELVQGGKVYAVTLQSTEPKRKLFSAPLTDLATQTTLVDGIDEPAWLVADETSLYYDGPTSILQVPLTGGTPLELVPGAAPHSVLSHGGYLYWIDSASNKLERVPAAGGPREPLLAVHHGGPMAATDTAIFWIDTIAQTIEKWEIGTAKSQTLSETIKTFSEYQWLAVAGNTVYFTFGFGCGYLYSVQDDGTGEQFLSQGIYDPLWVGATDDAVFLMGGNGLYRAER